MANSQVNESLIRYLSLVQQPGELELLILRAHMLAEELLHELIGKKLVAVQHFNLERITFCQSLSLAKAMYWREEDEWLWECLVLLNGARNHMAHKILKREDEKVLRKIDRMDELIGKNSGVPIPSKLAPSVQRIHWRLASLYSCMSRLPYVQEHSSLA
ncbi:MAG: hypothetical protein OEV28_05400 [Nitrospirota bacterium]|nr:hypothetical protein [Nitrospirota bacterium]